jgi:hypothetical protein
MVGTPRSSSKTARVKEEARIESRYFAHCNFTNILCFVFFALAVSTILFASYEAYQHNLREKDVIGWYCSGAFVILTNIISVRLMMLHFSNWNAGHVQKHVVRIIGLLPIYSIESWLALYYRHFSVYIETLKETYEAYVIWNFFFFLIALLGEEPHVLSVLRTKGKRGTHTFPFNLFLRPWNGHEIMHKCSLGVLQYVLFKILSAWMVMGLQYFDIYDEGEFKWDCGYLYLTILNNCSQIWALYCLAKFYYIMREELSHYKAIGKFLCVKVVVFWTWWQSVMINFLAYHTTLISSSENNTLTLDVDHQGSRFSNSQNIASGELYSWTDVEIAKGIQDFLITIEMLLAAVAFSYYFTHEEYLYDGGVFHAFSPVQQRPEYNSERSDSFHDTTMGSLINSLAGGATHTGSDEEYGRIDDDDNMHADADNGSDRRALLASERKNGNSKGNKDNNGSVNTVISTFGNDMEVTPRGKHKQSPYTNDGDKYDGDTVRTPHTGFNKRSTTGVLAAINSTFYPDDIVTDIKKNVFGSIGKKSPYRGTVDIELSTFPGSRLGDVSTPLRDRADDAPSPPA